jgi:hypothetical protein
VDCEQALALVVANMDREISPAERVHLEGHLRDCATCRATADALRAQDADLRRAFAPRRRAAVAVADRVITQLRTATPRLPRRLSWGPMLLAAAAGFLLAVLLFRPWQKHPEPVPQPQPQPSEISTVPTPEVVETLLLAVATQAVETMAPGSDIWQPVKTGAQIAVGSRVRTGPSVCCEFRTADGSEVRLNEGTELLFRQSRQIELSQGQIMARVAKAPVSFQVAIPHATVTALGTEFDLLCRPTAESVLTVLEGATVVQGKGTDQQVPTGFAAVIRNGAVERQEQVNDLIKRTAWIHTILIHKDPADKEVARRVNYLLADLGFEKTGVMHENEIRALGEACVLPLTRFLLDHSRDHGQRRHVAARIVADLAPSWLIPDLIKLLRDQDGEVRYEAARALQRLTGQNLGRNLDTWRRESVPSTQQAAVRQWENWWAKNKRLYPSTSVAAPVK